MPGIGEDAMRKQLRDMMVETEELRKKTKENDMWVENIKQVLKGDIPASKIQIKDSIIVSEKK